MSTANEYHNATKYDPETIRDVPPVDWAAQPEPYKHFHSKTRVALGEVLLLGREEGSDEPILLDGDPLSPTYELSRLSTLLLHVNGVTAQQQTHGEPICFRAAPSAGALYPTEIYVAIRDTPGVDDGIYNFQVRDHTLAPVLEGNYWRDLEAHTFGSQAITESNIVILFSVVFMRSSWRYHDRAYRRILLDSGHVMGNLMAFGAELGYSPVIVSAFNDGAIDELMFFDENAESTLMMAALPNIDVAMQPLGVSESAIEFERENSIQLMHEAGKIRTPEAKTTAPLAPFLIPGESSQLTFALSRKVIDWERDLGPSILLRRSTRGFKSASTMTCEQLGMMLGYGYLGISDSSQDLFLDPARLHTYVAVHHVEDLDAGLYRYDPYSSRLLLLKRGYFARENHEIGLGQDLMRDASVLIYHMADVDEAVTSTGDRAYRYLSLDAGNIGQRINIAALKLGLGVSGIGGYFDDQVNQLFQRPANEGVIYVTCVGQPA